MANILKDIQFTNKHEGVLFIILVLCVVFVLLGLPIAQWVCLSQLSTAINDTNMAKVNSQFKMLRGFTLAYTIIGVLSVFLTSKYKASDS
jgi:hypothetical protein